MAKSLRSKTKRSFRAKKREEGVYAAAHAARLQRLNSKLLQVASKDADNDVHLEGMNDDEDVPGWLINVLGFLPLADTQPENLAYISSMVNSMQRPLPSRRDIPIEC